MEQAIIFDVYGTLVSTGTGSVDAVAGILRKRGCSLPPEQVYARWKQLHRRLTAETAQKGFLSEAEIFRLGLWELYGLYGIEGDPDEDVQIMLRSLRGRKAFPDAAPALAHLCRHYRIFIGSNTDTAPLEDSLVRNGLTAEGVYTSESLRCYKPDPLFYSRLLERIGFPPEQVIFVGDSLAEDVEGPQRAGMRAVLVDRKGCFRPGSVQPDRILTGLPADGLLL